MSLRDQRETDRRSEALEYLSSLDYEYSVTHSIVNEMEFDAAIKMFAIMTGQSEEEARDEFTNYC